MPALTPPFRRCELRAQTRTRFILCLSVLASLVPLKGEDDDSLRIGVEHSVSRSNPAGHGRQRVMVRPAELAPFPRLAPAQQPNEQQRCAAQRAPARAARQAVAGSRASWVWCYRRL